MATPKDAAAIILLRHPAEPEVYWVRRSEHLQYLGGFHAYPGGQLDAADAQIGVANCAAEGGAPRACAIRELFEETGVLLAEGAARLTAAERSRWREALASGSKPFTEMLREHDLSLDATALLEVGRWVTPPFSPRRFDTWFFAAWLPDGQAPEIIPGELEAGEWIRPADALQRWERGEVLMVPPTIHALRVLAAGVHDLPQRMTAIPEARGGAVRRIEIKPGLVLFPVRTPTLPPATHTNCYLVGGAEFVVIDPASGESEEQSALDAYIEERLQQGGRLREIILTHHHPDHVGGVDHLRQKWSVPVAAHELTAARLQGQISIDRLIADDELIELPGNPGWRLRALHTPGHARGHLCFFEEERRALLSGDNVVGIGTVVIDPPEGNMQDYLHSLERMQSLPATVIFGAHGPPIGAPQRKIRQYIKHRQERESAILTAVAQGANTPAQIVEVVYTDVPVALHPLAQRSVLAHLEKLMAEGRVRADNGRYVV